MQFAWFVTPSVALADQQHKVISEHLPGFQTRLMTGDDGVKRWGRKSNWDEVMLNVRIVVSTHQVLSFTERRSTGLGKLTRQVLLDALVHGFVQMTHLAILVFDEGKPALTRSCSYFPPKFGLQHIIVLVNIQRIESCKISIILTGSMARGRFLLSWASLLVQSSTRNIEAWSESVRVADFPILIQDRMIEQSLNAISCTPKVNRDEMLRFVPRPNLTSLVYPPNSSVHVPKSLDMLQKLYANLDITEDPYVIKLMKTPDRTASSQLRKVLLSHQTYCRDQIKRLLNRAYTVFDELGHWATNYFIDFCIEKFEAAANEGSIDPNNLDDDEVFYLKKQLATITRSEVQDIKDDSEISPKAKTLIDFLQGQANSDFSGLVFVETRATVALLSDLLSRHSRTRDRFKVGTFVGASTRFSRFEIGELLDMRTQKSTLEELRHGRKNLIIATSALEEGIDVSACNHVVCFQKPPNLKSFIQRRGRARNSKSAYTIMFNQESDSATLSIWQDLEEEMKQIYMDETRLLKENQELEDDGEEGDREFRVDSTG